MERESKPPKCDLPPTERSPTYEDCLGPDWKPLDVRIKEHLDAGGSINEARAMLSLPPVPPEVEAEMRAKYDARRAAQLALQFARLPPPADWSAESWLQVKPVDHS